MGEESTLLREAISSIAKYQASLFGTEDGKDKTPIPRMLTFIGRRPCICPSSLFAKAYSQQGMRAYGELVQEPEMDGGVDVVKHQKWSGANYVDELLKMVQGGVSSTSAMGKGVTEDQFH